MYPICKVVKSVRLFVKTKGQTAADLEKLVEELKKTKNDLETEVQKKIEAERQKKIEAERQKKIEAERHPDDKSVNDYTIPCPYTALFNDDEQHEILYHDTSMGKFDRFDARYAKAFAPDSPPELTEPKRRAIMLRLTAIWLEEEQKDITEQFENAKKAYEGRELTFARFKKLEKESTLAPLNTDKNEYFADLKRKLQEASDKQGSLAELAKVEEKRLAELAIRLKPHSARYDAVADFDASGRTLEPGDSVVSTCMHAEYTGVDGAVQMFVLVVKQDDPLVSGWIDEAVLEPNSSGECKEEGMQSAVKMRRKKEQGKRNWPWYRVIGSEHTTGEITVGRSAGRISEQSGPLRGHTGKQVKLPRAGLLVHPEPVNEQNKKWRDKFEVSVTDDVLLVQRVDAKGKWGQDLVLPYSDSLELLEDPVRAQSKIFLQSVRTGNNIQCTYQSRWRANLPFPVLVW